MCCFLLLQTPLLTVFLNAARVHTPNDERDSVQRGFEKTVKAVPRVRRIT